MTGGGESQTHIFAERQRRLSMGGCGEISPPALLVETQNGEAAGSSSKG